MVFCGKWDTGWFRYKRIQYFCMCGSTHSLHEEKIDTSKKRCIRQKTRLCGFSVRYIIILWSGVRIPSPLPKIQPRFIRGLIFGLVVKDKDTKSDK